MSDVIYVNPYGMAHTVDQMHRRAKTYNSLVNLARGFISVFESVKKTSIAIFEEIAELWNAAEERQEKHKWPFYQELKRPAVPNIYPIHSQVQGTIPHVRLRRVQHR